MIGKENLIDCGFGEAIIRKVDLTQEDLNTAFIFNLIVGIFCYGVIFSLSPFIADFFQVPILEQLLRLSSVSVLVSPLCMVQNSLLTRNLHFKNLGIISIASSIISGIIGVALAFTGFES